MSYRRSPLDKLSSATGVRVVGVSFPKFPGAGRVWQLHLADGRELVLGRSRDVRDRHRLAARLATIRRPEEAPAVSTSIAVGVLRALRAAVEAESSPRGDVLSAG